MTRNAHCIFCDDIRNEVGNKLSFMGIYGGELQVEQIPAVIQKICIVSYCETSAAHLLSKLSIRIFHKENLILENEVPPEHLQEMQRAIIARGDQKDPIQKIAIGMNAQISPVVIDEPSTIKVVMIADNEEIIAGKLRMSQLTHQ